MSSTSDIGSRECTGVDSQRIFLQELTGAVKLQPVVIWLGEGRQGLLKTTSAIVNDRLASNSG
jgi:hypothetical protein